MTIAASAGGAGDGAARRVVSKAEFSRMIGRSKAAVTGYVKDGKISGRALDHEDGVERIVVDEALRQLDLTLDPIQRAAQASAASAAAAIPPALNNDQQRLVRANAELKETQALRARAELLASNGTWVRTAEIQPAWSRRLVELMALIEAAFPDLADELLAVPTGDRKSVILALRRGFRSVRQKIADQMGATAAGVATSQQAEEDEPQG
ncbi:hypothetical protein FFK22_008855 [Mycobacterium sp. KBS0706]|uniref:hypothetical protein n=1 Tax=Mycobacterium sp. KBS0706 TaxID=2578109 RepID=UPI00110F801A|nr:hypothetical protein [Mycobacterium sp. KBS0706]TSD89080.1 hypothetical protein FFK22_008855 [Mycobacterium sp. KBS0706]